MRRAIIAAVGTTIGLVALLDYKSSGTVGRSHVKVAAGAVAPATTTTSGTGPSGASPSSSAPIDSGPASSAPSGGASYTGQDVTYRYGDIQVRITVVDAKITAISIPEESASDPRSESINSQAIPILTSEALAAQGMNFDVVSGATFTSDAFAQSLQSALGQEAK